MSWKVTKLATDIACRAVSSLEGAGIFAVELFLTEDGQVHDLEISIPKVLDIFPCFLMFSSFADFIK